MPSFSADDIHEVRDLLKLKGSTTHGTVSFIVSQAIVSEDKYASAAWVMDDAGLPKPVTSPESPASSPLGSPDGRRLAFLSSRGSGTQVHLLDLEGGEAKPCGNLQHVPETIESWSPDGRQLLLTWSVPWPEDELDDVDAKNRPIVVRFLPYKLDGSGPVVGKRTHLVLLNIEDGATRSLVDGDTMVSEAAFSPDGQHIAFVRAREGRQRHLKDIYVIDSNGKGERKLTHDLTSLIGIRWSPDGTVIAVSGSETEGEAVSHLWLIDVRTGERRAAAGKLEVIGSGTTWSADGEQIAVIAEHTGKSSVAVIDVAGATYKVFDRGLRQVSALAAQGDRLVFAAATMRRPSELFTCGWDGGNETRRGNFNGWFKERPRPRVSKRRMSVPDGVGGRELIDVWLLRPPRGEGPWPALVYMHGGPESIVPIEHDRQMYWYELCEKGWLIIAPNAVGSSSYGPEFAQRLRGHWGERDLPQFLAVLDTLRGQGMISDRVACAGKSYGGFLSAWALGHTDCFTAGIISAPVANVLSHQGTSDTGYYVTPYAVHANADEDPATYHRLSPLTMFDKLKAPTLFLQGTEDGRCPAGQTEELFARAIRYTKAEVVMVLYPGGSHSLSASGRPSHRVDYNRRCARWLLDKA
jgi:dipeptidyl aminopeptidase/acylaminoacyl peptidase